MADELGWDVVDRQPTGGRWAWTQTKENQESECPTYILA